MKHLCVLLLCWFPLLVSAQSSSFAEDLPDVFGYFSTQKQLLKLDLFHAFKEWKEGIGSGIISVGYERKIGRQWSMQGEVSSWYLLNPQSVNRLPFQWKNRIRGFLIGPRFYYQHREHLTYGKQANNLVGNYWGLNMGTRFSPQAVNWPQVDEAHLGFIDNFSFIPHYGWQRKIMKRGFVDLNVGIKASYGENVRIGHSAAGPTNQASQIKRIWQWYPVSKIRLGFAF